MTRAGNSCAPAGTGSAAPMAAAVCLLVLLGAGFPSAAAIGTPDPVLAPMAWGPALLGDGCAAACAARPSAPACGVRSDAPLSSASAAGAAAASGGAGLDAGWNTWHTSRAIWRSTAAGDLTWNTHIRMRPVPESAPGTWQIALPNGAYVVAVICGDPQSLKATNDLLIQGTLVLDPDPWQTTVGYEAGDFDGYVVPVTVSNGLLTITPGPDARDPKLCLIEVIPAAGVDVAAAQARVDALVEAATSATWAAPLPTQAKRFYLHGSYIDDVLAYERTTSTGNALTYLHANHLYSVAAATDAQGAVVERYRYAAYGARTVTDASGAVERPVSAIGQSRGFTGYLLDDETGLYHARARYFAPELGRFISRDPLGYVDGMGLYNGYFVPNYLDPTGEAVQFLIIGGIEIAVAIGARELMRRAAIAAAAAAAAYASCCAITQAVEELANLSAASFQYYNESRALHHIEGDIGHIKAAEAAEAAAMGFEAFAIALDRAQQLVCPLPGTARDYHPQELRQRAGRLRKEASSRREVAGKSGPDRHFENNPKHGSTSHGTSKGVSSPTPSNPQRSLDNSIELPGNTTRRIGVDKQTGEISVFDEHTPGKFHGHVRKWDELSNQMQAALRKAGLVTKKGKIK